MVSLRRMGGKAAPWSPANSLARCQIGRIGLLLLLSGLATACWDFQPDPDQGPTAVPFPRLVSVQVEYRQPNDCFNVPPHCEDRVVFFGSWMRPGDEVLLTLASGTRQWTATAPSVPVNFPPQDFPHLVRVFDPHLANTDTGGITAARLVVGGQVITQYLEPGTPNESGLIYVDDNGQGRQPPVTRVSAPENGRVSGPGRPVAPGAAGPGVRPCP